MEKRKVIKHPTKESFLIDVKNHKLKVLKDDGLYRHLTFSSGSFYMWYEIITAPHILTIWGDMGSYTFTRVEDMFCFFRQEKLGVNPGYWAEKCISESRFGDGIRQFSKEQVYYNVRYELREFIKDNSKLSRKELRTKVKQVVEDLIHVDWENEYEARNGIYTYEGDVFHDAWEWTLTEYTYHYIWCLFAIVWGIQQYDHYKGKNYSKDT